MPDTTTPTSPAATEQPPRLELTRERFEQLEATLKRLEAQDRPALKRRVERARLFVDPTLVPDAVGVAEYDLAQVDAQITELSAQLARVVVIPPPTETKTVQIGALVTVRYEDDSEQTLALVGPFEANGDGDTVASSSALGVALLGKRPGDRVTAHADKDSLTVQIASISLPAVSADVTDIAES